jgi:hypothetical protein
MRTLNILCDPVCTVSVCSSVLRRCLRLVYMYDVLYDQITISMVGWDSSVGIATRYGLDGPDIESRWGARYFAPIQTGPGTHPATWTMVVRSFQGKKWPVRGDDPPPPSSAECKERVDPCLYSSSGLSCPVLGRTLRLRFTVTICYL